MTIDQAGWLYSHWSLLCEYLLFSLLTLGSLSQGLQPQTDMAAAQAGELTNYGRQAALSNWTYNTVTSHSTFSEF